MKNKLVILKNIFCVLTVVWSAIMLIEYIVILLPFQLPGLLFDIFDFLVIFLFMGIMCVPVLFVLSAMLIVLVRKKYDSYADFRLLNIVTVVIPIILAVLMLLTDFNSRLQ